MHATSPPDKGVYVNFRAVSWAGRPPIAGLHRLLLIEIARHANHAGHSWPAMATLADRAGVTVRHCRRLVVDLERTGYVRRINDTGKRTIFALAAEFPTTGVRETPDMGVRGAEMTPDMDVRPPRTPMSAPPRTPMSAVRVPAGTIKKGATPHARSAIAPPSAAGESSSRADERASIAAAWSAIVRAWKKADIGPLCAGAVDHAEAERRCLAIVAPAVRRFGRYPFVDAAQMEILQQEQGGRSAALLAILKRAVTRAERRVKK